jgi:peptidoglycan-N-acetylglucosamine deacetylase
VRLPLFRSRVAKYHAMNPLLLSAPVVAAGFAGLTAYGARHPKAQLFGPGIFGTDSPRRFALTFDDGPNPAITRKLLDLLEHHKSKATFFVVGKFVRECPGLVKETAVRGHTIGNHTETHPNLFFCGPEETRSELLRCSEAIFQATHEEPRLFRPPFGYRSPWLGEIVSRSRMQTVMWTLIPGDWRVKSVDWLTARMQPIADHAKQKLSTRNRPQGRAHGDVLCLHDGDYKRLNGDRSHTLAALEFWLPRWRDLGLEFVTITEASGSVEA